MNNGRFYIPGYMGMRNLPLTNPILGFASNTPKNIGLFSKITNGVRSVNWGGFLSNANKTLNVVNQAIPLVRQAGPMFNNMRSMLRIAKAFGTETNNNISNKTRATSDNVSINTSDNSINKNQIISDNNPSFFI